jgi:hypothetical protein
MTYLFRMKVFIFPQVRFRNIGGSWIAQSYNDEVSGEKTEETGYGAHPVSYTMAVLPGKSGRSVKLTTLIHIVSKLIIVKLCYLTYLLTVWP